MKNIKKVIVLTVFCVIISIVLGMLCSCVNTSNKNPVVTMKFDPESKSGIGGTVKIELYPEKAPNSVNFFIGLIYNKFYNELYATKVYAGHYVEIGDAYYIKKNDRVIAGEFTDNGYEGNDVEFERGTVGLCLDSRSKNKDGELDKNSANGDIFFILSDEAGKDYTGKYAAIGKVISGIEILDKISNIGTSGAINYQPMYSARTTKTTVDLKGKTYPEAMTTRRKYYPGYVTDDFLDGEE